MAHRRPARPTLLDPTRLVSRLDAVLLTGGSAFGLAAADGVMAWCEERGMGFPTAAGPVPIVVALGLYDLAVGDSSVRPGPAQGRTACETSTDGPIELGRVGAGTGATVAKWRGPAHRRPGGIVSASARRGELVVSALVAVNAFGEPGADPAEVAAAGDTTDAFTAEWATNTTVAVLATNAALDKVGCHLVSQGGHDGFARAIAPVHTRADGDAVVVGATGLVEGAADVVRALAVATVVEAIGALG